MFEDRFWGIGISKRLRNRSFRDVGGGGGENGKKEELCLRRRRGVWVRGVIVFGEVVSEL